MSNSRTSISTAGRLFCFSICLPAAFYSLRFRLLSRRRMNVADSNPLDGRVVDLDSGHLWRVFDQAAGGKPPTAHRDIDLANLGIERAQRHVLNRELGART